MKSELHIQKSVTPQQIAAAKERDLVPQSGDWNNPYRWVKSKSVSTNKQIDKDENDREDQRWWPDDSPVSDEDRDDLAEFYINRYNENLDRQKGLGFIKHEFLMDVQNAVLWEYKSDSYDFNKPLLEKNMGSISDLPITSHFLIELLDSAFKKNDTKLTKPITVFRGLDLHEYNDLIDSIGTPFQKSTYTSTSRKHRIAMEFAEESENKYGQFVAKVNIPRKARILRMDNKSEFEYLLPRDSVFNVYKDDTGKLNLDLILQDKS